MTDPFGAQREQVALGLLWRSWDAFGVVGS